LGVDERCVTLALGYQVREGALSCGIVRAQFDDAGAALLGGRIEHRID
jgi:hypothetical protein